MNVAIVGVGLIGGSIGLAARERAGARVRGFDPVPGAQQHGAVDEECGSVEAAVADADAVFVAVPVGLVRETVDRVLRAAPATCVVSDVGSTKRPVQDVGDPRFVGGHPLAGAETAGVEHARTDLFDGATWYLTPHPSVEGLLFERLNRLLRSIGAHPQAIDAATHDRVMAVVSHVPHVLANVLVQQAAWALFDEDERLPATGPSFRDLTRVAGAPTGIWRDIYLSNATAISEALGVTIERLEGVRASLEAGDADAVVAWNEQAAEARRRLLEGQLAGGDVRELRVSVPNRPGVVAEVALALGRASVNIVDMALYPAPDNASGVIALWVTGEEAEPVLAGLGYPVARA